MMSKISFSNAEKHTVSVVIPTLGGESLVNTINQLNRGTIIPAEVLVCIPAEDAPRIENLSVSDMRVIKTACRGQVAQRAIGFQKANAPFVLQLDDDILIDENCIEELLSCITGNRNIAVSPTLLDCQTGQPSRFMRKPTEKDSFLYKLLVRIVNGTAGYQAGRISKAGVNMAFSKTATKPYEVDWLPGGCVLHANENLVLHDFYPFPGKAYSEDLYHSYILRNTGVGLYHYPKAFCRVDFSSSKGTSIYNLVYIFFGFSRAMFRFAKLTGKSRLRYMFFLPVYILLLVIFKIKGK